MTQLGDYNDLSVEIEGHIATVEIQRPPHNFFDVNLIRTLADAYLDIDRESDARAIVLCSQGKNFCAGADLGGNRELGTTTSDGAVKSREGSGHLYQEGVRVFDAQTPVVAAIQGAAVGGGFGLALSADLRVASPEARFTSNFARLGFHQGFEVYERPTAKPIPRSVQRDNPNATIEGTDHDTIDAAVEFGLCDYLVAADELRDKARWLAQEIASSGPLAVRSIRRTMRRGLADRIRLATDHELVEQDWLRETDDFKEGVKAMSERRLPDFKGR